MNAPLLGSLLGHHLSTRSHHRSAHHWPARCRKQQVAEEAAAGEWKVSHSRQGSPNLQLQSCDCVNKVEMKG